MFCPYCGNSCADTHKFCYRCGKPLPEHSDPVPAPGDSAAEEVTPAVDQTVAQLYIATAETDAAPETQAENAEPAAAEETPAAPAAEIPEAPAVPAPQPKKGRLWPPLLVLCIMMFAGLAAFFIGGGTVEEPSCFSIESGVLYFEYSLYTGPDELTVPDTVDGMVVTAISDSCFENCDRLTTIILPETITIIGDNAFAGCDALRGIYIPNGVLSIGAGALSQCPELEAVVFPASIAEIGEGCLDDCGSLQYIFYDGTYAQWRELYDGTYRSGVELHTNDGAYYAQP